MLRSMILAAARSPRIERLVETVPVTRSVVQRFVAGVDASDAIRVAAEVAGDGLAVLLNHLGEHTSDAEGARAARDEYTALLRMLAERDLTPGAEVTLKLSELGQAFDDKLAEELARDVCAAAAQAGSAVTLDMEDHTTTDSTLEILGRLRLDYPNTGVAVQAYLRRAEADCRELALTGSRVRLCKGAYAEPESVAYESKLDIDKSYVRCLNILMSGPGYPMVATHDPRLIAIAQDRAKWFDRTAEEFEFQMLYGVRPLEQQRLAGLGYVVRLYTPYGGQWYPYLMRRLAERPANVSFFLRSLGTKS